MSTPFHDPASVTIKNLEAAFAGESMAHIKYRYFAKLCRATGDEATARVFEQTAEQELLHAFGHADVLFPAAVSFGATGGPQRRVEIVELTSGREKRNARAARAITNSSFVGMTKTDVRARSEEMTRLLASLRA